MPGGDIMRRLLILAVFLLGTAAAQAQVRDFDMLLGSSAPGGGTLKLAHDFCQAILVTPGLQAGGVTRHTSTQPGFNELLLERPGDIYPLRESTPISIRIINIDPGVSLKVGSALLAAPGETALVGNAPNLHVHPEWRLELADGQGGSFHVEFVLVTGSPRYGESPSYRFTLTTDPAARQLCNDGGGGVPPLDAGPVDHLLPGELLLLEGSPVNPARKSMRLRFPGPFDAAAGVDPTASGGRLRVLSNAGSFEGRYDLPAERWKPIRKRGAVVGWRFSNRRGPIRRMVVSSGGAITVLAAGSSLQQAIGQNPDPIDIWLAIGGTRACVRFGGAVTFKPGKSFKAVGAPPPDVCAP